MASYPLKDFVFLRILNEDPVTHALTLLGTLPSGSGRANAIVRVEKTALSVDRVTQELSGDFLSSMKVVESTDIYTWLHGWTIASNDTPDVKINIIFPATDVHIRKYSCQLIHMVRETPEIFDGVVKPYIDAFPPSRTQWVRDILSGKSEADKVLYRNADPKFGYVILPDMKWDLSTLSSLYLVAIAVNDEIRCLRDLKKYHLPMLHSIRDEAARIVLENWGLQSGAVRMFIHYQPSYYHFHVHIVNANYIGTTGSTVGQAHLLDDVISLLELEAHEGPSILQRMTFTYGLGEHHGLYALLTSEGTSATSS